MKIHLTQTGRNFDKTVLVHGNEILVNVRNFAKKDRNFTLVKYLSEIGEQTAKGEVIDSWYRVTLTKAFTDEKEPDTTVIVNYQSYAGAFPSPKSDDMEDEE